MQSNDSRDGGATERMRRAVDAAVNGKGSRGELEDAARTLVAELRRKEEPPERVLLRIKEFLAQAGLRPNHANRNDGDGDGHGEARPETIYRDVIAWAIKAYYEPTSD
jgi:hypothetical protein